MATKNNEIVKISDLTVFGDRLARSIRAKLGNITAKLRGKGVVQLSPGKSARGRAEIHISIGNGMQDPTSPTQTISGMIGAIEKGAKKHKISPRTAPGLAFKWPKANIRALRGALYREQIGGKPTKFKGFASGGRLAFKYVDHPGMKGYHPIRDAIAETKGKATEELSGRIRKNIVDTLNFTIREVNKKK